MSQNIQSVRGMNDILPGESELWELFDDTVRAWLKAYGYRPIRLPIVEPTPLFKRAIGEVTDIVEKEMYSFVDSLNGETLTLRPEGTAGCVRALIQHKLAAQHPQRLYYMGQMFRHERPQKGRYRQFIQVGIESFGFAGPDIDAEQILMGARLWDDLGLDDIKLQLNTLGDAESRDAWRTALVDHFEAHRGELSEDSLARLDKNPRHRALGRMPWTAPCRIPACACSPCCACRWPCARANAKPISARPATRWWPRPMPVR